MRMLVRALVAFPIWCDPSLLLNPSDRARIDRMSNRHVRAKEAREELPDAATDWREPHVREFGQEGGKKICPVEGKDSCGWPIDNVVYMQRNDDNARSARDLRIAQSNADWDMTFRQPEQNLRVSMLGALERRL